MRKRQLKKAYKKAMLSVVGFTGVGPTLLEKKYKGPKLTWRELHKLGPSIEAEKDRRKDCFRQACIDVLGEDPEDWGLTKSQYEAKYGI